MKEFDRAKLFDRFSDDVKKRFNKYHIENPHVYQEFASRAKEMAFTGRTKYSARTIFEVMRWDWDIKTTATDFKISNDFIPIYVRLLICDQPSFYDFFSLKGEGD